MRQKICFLIVDQIFKVKVHGASVVKAINESQLSNINSFIKNPKIYTYHMYNVKLTTKILFSITFFTVHTNVLRCTLLERYAIELAMSRTSKKQRYFVNQKELKLTSYI